MVSQTIRIGKIFGIEIGINYSWFIVFGLVTVILAVAYFPLEYTGLTKTTYVTLGLITSILFFFSVIIHELAHSLIAKLNNIPIKSITLFIFGGVSHMGKEPDSPGAEFQMAIAGPLASFILAVVFGVVWFIASTINLGVMVTAPARYLSFINLMLGIFNLVPGFPLDGGRVLRSAIWYVIKDLRKATRVVSILGQGFASILILIGLYFIFVSTEFLWNGIWLIFIGWFLFQSAGSGYKELVLRDSLSGVKVSDIMTKEVIVISDSLSLEEAVDQYFMRFKHGRFPVVNETDNVIGSITLHQVRDVPREEWSKVLVKDTASQNANIEIISPDKMAEDALVEMAEKRIGHLLVMDNGRLAGIVTKSDLMSIIQMRTRLGM